MIAVAAEDPEVELEDPEVELEAMYKTEEVRRLAGALGLETTDGSE